MTDDERCPECGGWGEQCLSDTPVKGCACNRCLLVTLDHMQAELRQTRTTLDEALSENEHLRNLFRTIDFWLDEWGVGYSAVTPRTPPATVDDVTVAVREMHTQHLRSIGDLKHAMTLLATTLKKERDEHAHEVAKRQRDTDIKALVDLGVCGHEESCTCDSTVDWCVDAIRTTPLVTVTEEKK